MNSELIESGRQLQLTRVAEKRMPDACSHSDEQLPQTGVKDLWRELATSRASRTEEGIKTVARSTPGIWWDWLPRQHCFLIRPNERQPSCVHNYHVATRSRESILSTYRAKRVIVSDPQRLPAGATWELLTARQRSRESPLLDEASQRRQPNIESDGINSSLKRNAILDTCNSDWQPSPSAGEGSKQALRSPDYFNGHE